MTDPADEQAQNGPGEFRDVVDVLLIDETLLVAARIARIPSERATGVTAIVLADGEPAVEISQRIAADPETWGDIAAGPLQLRVLEPLRRWTFALDAPDAAIELELRALSGPADIAEPGTAAIARMAGVQRYSQLCEARGTAVVNGTHRTVDAFAIRSHTWGAPGEAGRTRFLTAASEDGTLLTIAALRPQGARGHGDELIGGQMFRAGGDGEPQVQAFETVRLSTVFDERGLPAKAGVELFRPGDELPSRLSGAAVGAIAGDVDASRGSLALFRFGLDGVPALGAYEIEAGDRG